MQWANRISTKIAFGDALQQWIHFRDGYGLPEVPTLSKLCALRLPLVRYLLEAFEQEGGSFLCEGERWTTEAYPMGHFKSC